MPMEFELEINQIFIYCHLQMCSFCAPSGAYLSSTAGSKFLFAKDQPDN